MDLRGALQRRDRPKPGRPLTLGSLFPQKSENRLKSGAVAGFGRLHRGKNRPRRGTKRRIERLGGALDFLSEEKGLVRSFITLTCPGSSKDAIEAFSAWTGYLLNRLNEWLRMRQSRYSGQKDFFRLHVWELQKRGAEHVHYVCLLSRAVFLSVTEDIRLWYANLLQRVSQLSGVDIFERADGKGSWSGNPGVLQIKVEEVVKSVSAYLSKYVGKTMGQRERGFTARLMPRPARLWGASRCLKRALNQCSISRYFHVPKTESAQSLSAIVVLAEKMQSKYSFQVSQSGLMARLRCFLGGDRQSQRQLWDDMCEELAKVERLVVSEGREVPPMGVLYKKALRIRDKNAKRVAFVDLYGADIYKSVLAWISGQAISRLEVDLLVDCLNDFDEITLGSLRGIVPAKGKNKRTVQQLQLLLYPGMP